MFWTSKRACEMKRSRLICAASTLTLMSCVAIDDPYYQQFINEAGSVIDGGTFGNATASNTLVIADEQRYSRDLANRFANEVLTTVNFAFNSDKLDSAAQETLREQANWIRQFPELRFRVFGHTDLVGSATTNHHLGLRRAQSVVKYLAAQGIARNRLEAVSSLGETQPLIVTEGRERRNRRTITEVTGFVSDHPQVLDGNYATIIYRTYIGSNS